MEDPVSNNHVGSNKYMNACKFINLLHSKNAMFDPFLANLYLKINNDVDTII